ncbi:MAG: molybdopterin biosynthesis protein, partial [Clostridia bacterium]|nr:molybdopterin biosynthesis protein [Clostridia bacterium]
MNGMDRNIYISNMEVEKALELLKNRLKPFMDSRIEEAISTLDSIGRVSAKAVIALVSSPNYNASAM